MGRAGAASGGEQGSPRMFRHVCCSTILFTPVLMIDTLNTLNTCRSLISSCTLHQDPRLVLALQKVMYGSDSTKLHDLAVQHTQNCTHILRPSQDS